MTMEFGHNGNWTKATLISLLERNDMAVCRAVVAIDNRQTMEEHATDNTIAHNGRGWGKFDAKFGSKMAELVRQWERGESVYAAPLSEKQVYAARRMVLKYTRQLLEAIKEREVVV